MSIGKIVSFTSLLLFLVACTGGEKLNTGTSSSSSSASSSGVAGPVVCNDESIAAPLLRRLSQAEYNATLDSLLGDGAAVDQQFIGTSQLSTFVGGSAVGDSAEVIAQLSVANDLAKLAIERLPELENPAFLNSQNVKDFISSFGFRAFRRPLSDEQTTRYLALYEAGKKEQDNEVGLQWMLTGLFGSPHFIYHVDAQTATNTGDSRYLSEYEIASRLSYFLTGDMPDDTLFLAAQNGELSTKAQIYSQAQRLIATEDGKARIADFFLQWLGVKKVYVNDGLKRFGDASNAERVSELLVESLKQTILRAIEDDTVDLTQLLTSSEFIVGDELAAIWGLEAASKVGPNTYDFSEENRAGIFSHPAVLAAHATTGFATPSLRGGYMLEHLVCDPVPEPPQEVVDEFPMVDGSLPDREAMKIHNEREECALCHRTMDPLGFAFGNFDAGGRFQTMQKGKPVDTTGTAEIHGVQISFSNVKDLMPQLADMPEVRTCIGRHVLRYAMGRLEEAQESCSIDQYAANFNGKGESVSEIFTSLVTTETFRKTAQPGGR